jgi:spoIIIJ-associated protein
MNWHDFLTQTLNHIGFQDFSLDIDTEHKHAHIVINDTPALTKEQVASLIQNLNHIIQLISKKQETYPVFIDINNYRREREELISQLARVAAQKVMATKAELSLPPMNSYERRLVHMALAHHPEVITESSGGDKARCVIIKLVE